jgi:TetR/AcrR family fatty acid metabolism transcriptional regulator
MQKKYLAEPKNMARYSKEITRERIVQAAFDTFNSLDFHEAKVRDIAKKSGISPASIYKHFRGKEGLAQAICTEKVKLIIAGIEEHLTGVRGALNKLRKMTWFYLSFYERNPGVAWVLRISTSPKTWCDSPASRATIVDTGAIFKSIIREGQDTGEIRQDINIRVASSMYFGGLHHLVAMWLILNQQYSLTAFADDFVDMISAMVRKPEEQEVPFQCPFLVKQKDAASPKKNQQQSSHSNP